MWSIQDNHNHNNQETQNTKNKLKKEKRWNKFFSQKLAEQLFDIIDCPDSELGQDVTALCGDNTWVVTDYFMLGFHILPEFLLQTWYVAVIRVL